MVGAAFLLAWGAEALQLDVSRGLALAVLALIAVLPEYVVDFTFASKAGSDPQKYAPLALANMTGTNRLLIGVGWSVVVFIAAWRIDDRPPQGVHGRHRGRHRGPPRPLPRIEIGFLAIATLYSLTLPLKDNITLFDAASSCCSSWCTCSASPGPVGGTPPCRSGRLLGELPTVKRRVFVGIMLGVRRDRDPDVRRAVRRVTRRDREHFGISTFLLVQWLAPLASEAPELLIAGLFAWRLNTNGGLGTLVSSKVNQWTLLVGSLPIVFVVAGGATSGLPLDPRQREELFLTAAQSAFAVAVLASRSISVREAAALLGLFLSQFVLGALLPPELREWERIIVGIVYLVLAVAMIIKQRRSFPPLVRDAFRTPVDQMIGP